MKDTTNLDKVAWNRLYVKMQTQIAKVNAIEDTIMDLQLEKMSHMDNIQEIKKELDQTCIHPEEWVVRDKDDATIATCKLCGKTIRNVDGETETN
jgi:hypothetical protein